jgi:hypothetical protein
VGVAQVIVVGMTTVATMVVEVMVTTILLEGEASAAMVGVVEIMVVLLLHRIRCRRPHQQLAWISGHYSGVKFETLIQCTYKGRA